MFQGPLPERLRSSKVDSRSDMAQTTPVSAQGNEGQHAVHDRSLKKPHSQAGDETRTEHALDGGHGEAHVISEVQGILQFSQRSVCIITNSQSRVWPAIDSGQSNGRCLERCAPRRRRGG